MNRKHYRAKAKTGGTMPQSASPAAQGMLTDAVRHHQAGRLSEAEGLYRRILAVNARHPDCLHLLGVIAYQTGRHEEAVESIRKAIGFNPRVAAFHSHLSNALQALRRFEEAAACCRKAIELGPKDPEGHYNLGVALGEQGRLDDAAASYRRTIELAQNDPEAYVNLGVVLQRQGRLEEAVGCYRKAIALRPAAAEAHSNLANALHQQGLLDEAVATSRRALELVPSYPEAHYNLGVLLAAQGRLEEAAGCYRAAIGLRANYPDAHSNLGNVLRDQGQPDLAAASYRRAIALRPDFADAHNNLGNALRDQGRLEETVACYRRAIDLKPEHADAHKNLALALLSRGEMADGWAEYEWRWKTPQRIGQQRGFAQPQWLGEAAEGLTVLIHAEQGFGDTLQFCRYAPLAAERGLRVVMEVPAALVRLLGRLPGVELVVAGGGELPPFDLHCPMLSLPFALGTTLDSIPRAESYLRADAAQAEAWATRLAGMVEEGPRVGLVWAGSAALDTDRRRSLDPARLAPLFEVPGIQFFSLQKVGLAAPADLPLLDLMDEVGDFSDTAALIANLDLVVSVDTAVAHLAAAMGKPVWLLDRYDSCWRWLIGRRDSPWYPALRIYRQPEAGAWDAVVAEVAGDLRRHVPGTGGESTGSR